MVNIPIRYTAKAKACFDGVTTDFVVNFHDAQWQSITREANLYDEGITIDWEGDENDIFAPIIPSTATIQLFVQDQDCDDMVDDILLLQEDRFFISITVGPEVYWRGVVLQDQIRIEDSRGCFPYECQIKAVDGLVRLKEYTQFLGTNKPALQHIEFIVYILNKVMSPGLYTLTEPYVKSYVRWYDAEHPANSGGFTTDPLLFTRTAREDYTFIKDDDGIIQYQDLMESFR